MVSEERGTLRKMYDIAVRDILEYSEAIERVRALHAPNESFPDGCDFCDRFTPCETIEALGLHKNLYGKDE